MADVVVPWQGVSTLQVQNTQSRQNSKLINSNFKRPPYTALQIHNTNVQRTKHGKYTTIQINNITRIQNYI